MVGESAEKEKEDCAEGKEETEEAKQEPQTVEEDPCYDYKLVGVVLHQGPSAEAGHYISYMNVERGDPEVKRARSPSYNFMATESEKWLEFNDSLVKHFSFTSLESECFGSNAYGGGSSTVYTDDNYYQSSGFSNDTDTRRCAYMLVYERRRKKDLKVIVDPEAADTVKQEKADYEKRKEQAA